MTPGEGVVVDVRAAGVAFPEVLQTRGQYQVKPPLPIVPGSEVAGVVRSASNGSGFAPGDRVAAFCMLGGFAEVAVAPPWLTFALPDALDFAQGAGLILNYHTAYFSLKLRGRLAEGETVLVHGAAGGVGTAAVQLGAATGAEVIASVRNPDHRDAVAALGAHQVIEPEGFGAHGPFDVILELVGAPNLAENVKALNTLGRIVVIGISAGAKGELNLGALMGKRGRVSASMLRARSLEEKALVARAVERHVLPLIARGAVDVPIAESYALEDAPAAYERFAAGGKLGKIVLTMGS
jgi:NADPH:quinone reductase-like Zn-dependent oxidoreductase